MNRHVQLQNVTLCSVSSVAIQATLRAFLKSMAGIDFASIKFFSHNEIRELSKKVDFVRIEKIESRNSYSNFIMKVLPNFIETDYVIIIQWDGYILNPAMWHEDFLKFDYIGAPWPHFHDNHRVGNGGFSLRSRRLLQACLDDRIKVDSAEDVAICRDYRPMLERDYGIKFADESVARKFSYERTSPTGSEFGFHGAFNLAKIIDRKSFLQMLDELERGVLGRRDRKDLLMVAIKSGNWRLAKRILMDTAT